MITITYRVPGDLKVTYATGYQSYPFALWYTWRGGLALWRMWLRAMLNIAMSGRIPYPSLAAAHVAGVMTRWFDESKRETAP